MRKRLAAPRYPAIFYLPQAHEAHSLEVVSAPPKRTVRCSAVARSERGISGSRAGWGGAVREPVSCALEAGHAGLHKGVSLSVSVSHMQAHWEWSQSDTQGMPGDGVPEDAAEKGPAAIATFSGRIFDGSNQGVQGLLPPGVLLGDPWGHAGLRFRIGIVSGAVSLVVVTVFLWLLIGHPRWQFAAAMGLAYVFSTIALVQAGAAMRSFQDRISGLGGQVQASDSPLTD